MFGEVYIETRRALSLETKGLSSSVNVPTGYELGALGIGV
jgi:hypothetical protein